MPPPSIAVALLKVVTLPTHPHPCPCTHRGLIYNTRKSIPLSQALQHGWLRKTASPSSVSVPTTKSTSTDCVLKTDGGSCLVKGGVFGRPPRIVANGESRSRVGSWMMIGSGSVQSVVGERDLRRMSRKWASGDPYRGGEAGIAEKDEQEPPVMGIIDHQEENDNVDEADRSMGINDVNGEQSILDQQSKLLTIPTVLTLGRVAAVPLLITTFYMDGRWATTATTSIFIVASVTDWLDGYIARKMRLGSTFGAFLDPVADKLMVAAALVLLCTKPLEAALFSQFPWLLTLPSIAIIGREITMSAVREWAASQNSGVLEAVAVNNLGKWKTATQMTALTILLASRDSSLVSQGVLVAAGLTLLNISAALAVWSLAVYMRKIWRVLLK